MHEGFLIREDLLPISLLITTRTLTRADADQIFEYYRDLCRRRIQFVAISDLRASKEMPDAKTRQHFAEHSARFSPQSRVWSLGLVAIVDSSLIRGALTAIEWFARPALPTTYCGNLKSAVERAAAALQAGNVPLTPAIRDFQQRAELGYAALSPSLASLNSKRAAVVAAERQRGRSPLGVTPASSGLTEGMRGGEAPNARRLVRR